MDFWCPNCFSLLLQFQHVSFSCRCIGLNRVECRTILLPIEKPKRWDNFGIEYKSLKHYRTHSVCLSVHKQVRSCSIVNLLHHVCQMSESVQCFLFIELFKRNFITVSFFFVYFLYYKIECDLTYQAYGGLCWKRGQTWFPDNHVCDCDLDFD